MAAEKIRAGRPVLLFAEGTRSRDGALQPFKKGPFHLALQARVPLIPVAIRGSWQVMRPGSVRVNPGPVEVEFLPAVDPAEFLPNDTAGLSNRLRETIRRAREAERVA
jgi:1-acyl-sn-glycerol-3-phosphate acyltransferase